MPGPLDTPIASAELLCVDTETNGRNGDLCEMTEVGAVLVGGGELHDRWESLVRVEMPLQRGIQRFTGITQSMVDSAPPATEVLPRLAERMEGRVLVAHNAAFDRRVLEQAFERAGLEWPKPAVLCTVALSRKLAPLVRKRGLASLADSLGIEVEAVHRALPDAETCARVLCALFKRLCVHAGTVGEAVELCRSPRRRGKAKQAQRPAIPKEERPDLSDLPKDPGVYVFRDERGRPLYVGKSVSLRTRARAHFTAPAGWTERAAVVDYKPTNSELGALVLENRLIKQWQPPGNRALKRTDKWVYVRCRLDVEYPILEVAPEPASGRALSIGPLRGRKLATELADHLTSLFKLRHCGRTLHRREHPSLYGQMGRCCSPCLGDLDPNAYRRQVDLALGLFEQPDARDALLGEIERRLRDASEAQRYEAAAALLRRRERLELLLDRLGGMLRAVNAEPLLVTAEHPVERKRRDAFWVVGGLVADWGPLPTRKAELRERARAALEAAPDPRAPIAKEHVDEIRIVSAWVAEHEPRRRPLAELAA